MIGLDTNILVRYLTQDDPTQCKIINQLFSKAETDQQVFYINQVVLIETVWVLESCYNKTHEELAAIISSLLLVPRLNLEGKDKVWNALQCFIRSSSLDFSDCLIASINNAHECPYTYTLDKLAAQRISGLRLLTTHM